MRKFIKEIEKRREAAKTFALVKKRLIKDDDILMLVGKGMSVQDMSKVDGGDEYLIKWVILGEDWYK